MKKLFLNLGASIAIVAPIISLIACGTGKLEDLKGKDLNKTKSSTDWTTMSKPIINETTMSKPIIDWSTMTNPIVDESKIGNAIIDESKIGTSIIDQSKIGTSIIDESKIRTSIIDESKIGTSIIDESKIGTSIIDESKIGTSIIDESKLKNSIIDQSTIGNSLIDQIAINSLAISNIDTTKVIQVKNNIDLKIIGPIFSADPLTRFMVSEDKEDPHIDKYLNDVTHDLREFRVYDNGVFKIKIEKKLIGQNRYFENNSKADFQAQEIAKSISMGPAINHLEKGIQLLQSDFPASLGGVEGVQISMTNKYGSIDDQGIKTNTALVTHEYGHHETLWDFGNILGGRRENDVTTKGKLLRDVMVEGLKNSGYQSISSLIRNSKNTVNYMDKMDSSISDYPTDYGPIVFSPAKIYNSINYFLNPPESATRILNILSYRTNVSPTDLYVLGKNGIYNGIKRYYYYSPEAFFSDLSLRHFANDSVFGEGKESSRIDKLIDFYMKDIFGEGNGRIKIRGNRDKGIFSGISLDAFNYLKNLDKLEVINSKGKIVAWTKTQRLNSRFGFKNELITNKWSTEFKDNISYINNFNFNITDANSQIYKIIGRDKFGNEVDLSGLRLSDMGLNNSKSFYLNNSGMNIEGKHLVLNY